MSVHIMRDGVKKSQLKGAPLTKVVSTSFQAMHGGAFDYTKHLPSLRPDGTWIPGEWTKELDPDDIDLCRNGYHLTNDPYGRWSGDSGLVFLAEGHIAYDDGGAGAGRTDSDKISFASIRLLAPDDKTIAKLAKKGFGAGATNPYTDIVKQLTEAPFLNASASARPPSGLYSTPSIFDSRAEAEYAVSQAGGTPGSYVPASRPAGVTLPSEVTGQNLVDANTKINAHTKTLGYRGPFFPLILAQLAAELPHLPTGDRKRQIDEALQVHKAGFGIAGRVSGRLYLYRRA